MLQALIRKAVTYFVLTALALSTIGFALASSGSGHSGSGVIIADSRLSNSGPGNARDRFFDDDDFIIRDDIRFRDRDGIIIVDRDDIRFRDNIRFRDRDNVIFVDKDDIRFRDNIRFRDRDNVIFVDRNDVRFRDNVGFRNDLVQRVDNDRVLIRNIDRSRVR